jgi:hypothetical protein
MQHYLQGDVDMERRSTWITTAVGMSACLAMTACAAYEASPSAPSAICERYELGVCILPPLPTTAQLKKGRELIDKIAHVINNVPLTDGVAVMRQMGFENLLVKKFPDHISITANGKSSNIKNPSISVSVVIEDPWSVPSFEDPNHFSKARFTANIKNDLACIQIEDVISKFGTTYKESIKPLRVHNAEELKKSQALYGLWYEKIPTPKGNIGGVNLVYEYQKCAKSFAIHYVNER